MHEEDAVHIHLPSPTPWPLVLALGITLMPAGVILGPAIPLVGELKLPIVTLVGMLLFVVSLLQLVNEDIVLQRGGH